MAPTDIANDLTKRQWGYSSYGCGYNNYDDNCNSAWADWGRWVLLVGIIIVVLLIFFLFSCINARRRRRQGARPMYGTGWMAPGHGAVQYYGPGGPNNAQNPQQYQTGYESYNAGQAPPAYNPGQHGYYGQESGVEMQPPTQSYQPGRNAGGTEVYSPPAGPPPGKEGAIIR